ncbi:MAG: hypothetical protein E7585_02130 [Ruminococcaceae bacterium]|nr:hypothetical protein [Oscillospiraceae bacterium]
MIFEYLGIFSYFLLLFQRQNMLVVLLGGLWIGVASLDFKRLSRRNKILLCAGGVVAIIVLALLFGVVGNVRYGLWQWFDSSMICEVGAINDRWPPFVPKLMAWAYVYMISPLANLQCNYLAGIQAGLTFADYMWQLVPSCFANYIPHVSAVDVKLLHPALIVSTAFVAVYRIGGIGGMFAFYFIEIALIVAVVFATQKRIEHSCAYYMGLFYFFMMNFFDNPVAYEITAFMIMYPLLYELFALIVKEVRKLISKHKKPVAVTAETDAPTVIQEGAENDAPSMVQEAASNDEQPPAEDD